MSKITGIKRAESREKRVNIFLDGKPALALLAETALKEKIKVGQEVTASRRETLAEADRYQRCLNAAVRLLGYRPRSEKELKERLRRRGYNGECLQRALATVKERGLADDGDFARFWLDNRETFSPRSRRLMKMELKGKGLSDDIIERTTGEIDDMENAYRAAMKRAPRLSTIDYNDFRRRLGTHLGRRGFSYGVIKEITERIWKEQKTDNHTKSISKKKL